MDGTEIYGTDPADGEDYRIAEIRPSEAVADPAVPFSDWDTRYTGAVQVTDLELNTLSARCYHLQEVDEESVVGSYRNTLVYCICLGDRMAVIELTPLMGRGGISSTRDPFEKALFYTTAAMQPPGYANPAGQAFMPIRPDFTVSFCKRHHAFAGLPEAEVRPHTTG